MGMDVRLAFPIPTQRLLISRPDSFIIEGLLTFVVACAAPFLMDDFPEVSVATGHSNQSNIFSAAGLEEPHGI